jgi:predicted N-acetyltransferase YhbS
LSAPTTLRPATPADASECGRICYEAFRAIAAAHGFAPDFPSVEFAQMVLGMMLGQPKVTGFVAECDGRIAGSALLSDGGAIAGIGPVSVDPARQDGGVGRRLMERLLELCAERDVAGVRLVQAAYHCRSMSLYARLGFEVREPLVCLQGAPLGLAPPLGFTVRAATRADLEACNLACFRVHGHARQSELLDAIGQGTATLVERDGRVTGYLTALAFFGHAVAETALDLQALIGAAPVILGPGFLLPSRHAELLRWSLAHGLRVTQPLTLMTLGLYAEPRGAFLPSVLY